MTPLERRSRWTLVVLLGTLAAVSGWGWWLVVRDPGVSFLSRWTPAEWILYPTTPTGFVRPGVELESVFRSSLVLAHRPSSARLRVRCHREGTVTINGTPVSFSSSAGD